MAFCRILCTFAAEMTKRKMKKLGRLLATFSVLLVSVVAHGQTVQQWRDSLEVLNRLIVLHPHDADLRLRKAAVNIELGQWDYAIEEYGRVLQENPENLSALYFRAYAENHERRYDMARADYERFLHISPLHFEARFGLAMVKRNMGKRTETMDELNRLVELFPDSALAYAARADYEAELEQYEVSLFDWDEALRLQPDNTEFQAARLRTANAKAQRGRRRR